MIMLFVTMKRCSYIIFGVLIFATGFSEGLLVAPNKTAVVKGSITTFNCSSSRSSVQWAWTSPNGEFIASSAVGSPCSVATGYVNIYDVSASGSSYCNLIILNATLAIAGSYGCSDAPLSGGSAVLLVLDSNPHCSTDSADGSVVYPNNVTMICSVQFNSASGNNPTLQWNQINSTTSYPIINTAYSSFNYTTQTSTTRTPSYICRVSFDPSFYVDIPDSKLNCSTNPVTINWCPREITISGANTDNSIEYGKHLICSASGNPDPKYQWFNSANNLFLNGSSLPVTGTGNYTCFASNNATPPPCTNSLSQNIVNVTNIPPPTTNNPTTNKPATTTVTNTPVISQTSSDMPTNSKVTGTGGPPPMPQDGPCPTSCIIGIVVGVGGGLILIIIIAVCCCKRNRKKPKPTKQTTSTDNLTTTTADISYNSHLNRAFDNVPPPYDNFHLPPENSVNFSIFYNKNQSQLTVKLIQAIELVPGSRSKTAHPFARVSLLPERRDPFQSRIHPNTLSPQFDEEFSFQVPARQVTEKTVEILLFDANDDDRCMGQVHLPLDQVDLTEGLNSAWKGISQCEKKTQGYGGSMGTVPVNSPYSYEDVVPNKSQRVNGDPKSLYPNRNNPIPVQLKMDNTARSRQPLQGVEMPIETGYGYMDDPVQYAELEKDYKPKQLPQAVANYKETEYATVKIA